MKNANNQENSIEAKDTLIDSQYKKIVDLESSLESQIKLYESFKTKYEEIVKENEAAINEKNEYQKICIGFDEIKKERNERIKMLQDRLSSLEYQSNYNEK